MPFMISTGATYMGYDGKAMKKKFSNSCFTRNWLIIIGVTVKHGYANKWRNEKFQFVKGEGYPVKGERYLSPYSPGFIGICGKYEGVKDKKTKG